MHKSQQMLHLPNSIFSDRAFQRITDKTLNACKILPTLKNYFQFWNIKVLVKEITEKKSPGSTVLWKALINGLVELENRPDAFFEREGC